MSSASLQARARAFVLATPRCALFLGMGAGKTKIALDCIAELVFNRLEVGRVLVVAPLRVARTSWPDEIKKWQPQLSYRLILGEQKKRLAALASSSVVHIINYDNLTWLAKVAPPRYDLIILDESSKLKNHSTARWRAFRQYLRAKPPARIVLMTGTPAPNSTLELWAPLYLLDQGRALGRSFSVFRERYFFPDQRNWQTGQIYSWQEKPGTKKAIQAKIAPLAFHEALPAFCQVEKHAERYLLDNPDEYRTFALNAFLAVADLTVTSGAASLQNKLRQYVSGFVYTEHGVAAFSTKRLEVLGALLERLEGRGVIVYYNFIAEKDQILKAYGAKYRITCEADLDGWNGGAYDILLAHPASMAYGLNLQHGGSAIVWYSLPWSLEQYEQANARLARPGQKRTVDIVTIIAEGTVDERVLSALEEKKINQDKILEGVKHDILRTG